MDGNSLIQSRRVFDAVIAAVGLDTGIDIKPDRMQKFRNACVVVRPRFPARRSAS
jgi:hypothetical protein